MPKKRVPLTNTEIQNRAKVLKGQNMQYGGFAGALPDFNKLKEGRSMWL